VKNKLFSLVILLIILGAFVIGCQEGESASVGTKDYDNEVNSGVSDIFEVGYTNLSDSDVFCMERLMYLREYTKDNDQLEITYLDAQNDVASQLSQIDTFINQEVDAIIVVPVDYDDIAQGIIKANEAGIPVITFGIESSDGDYCFVGSANIESGRMQGEYISQELPHNAKVLMLEGDAELYHSKERKEGFLEVIKTERRDITLLDSKDGKYSYDEGVRITEEWLAIYAEVDAIVAANDQMALGAIDALEEAGRLNDVVVVGVDGIPKALEAIASGKMSMSVFQNARIQAEQCVIALNILLESERLPEDILVPFEIITIENVNAYIE